MTSAPTYDKEIIFDKKEGADGPLKNRAMVERVKYTLIADFVKFYGFILY